jgi:hypothetical protein
MTKFLLARTHPKKECVYTECRIIIHPLTWISIIVIGIHLPKRLVLCVQDDVATGGKSHCSVWVGVRVLVARRRRFTPNWSTCSLVRDLLHRNRKGQGQHGRRHHGRLRRRQERRKQHVAEILKFQKLCETCGLLFPPPRINPPFQTGVSPEGHQRCCSIDLIPPSPPQPPPSIRAAPNKQPNSYNLLSFFLALSFSLSLSLSSWLIVGIVLD